MRVVSTGETIPLRGTLVVGSTANADIRSLDPYLSAKHCRIYANEDRGAWIEDLDSKNGTYVNGVAVRFAKLRAGDQIKCGRTQLLATGPLAGPRLAIDEMIGTSQALDAAKRTILAAAGTSCHVLILGPTGTGKELAARAIHQLSSRNSGPFVPVNCGAFPAELIAGELFGCEKGAFTGAVKARDGLIRSADKGTLFLDELGELPLPLQPMLLRALETKRVRPVGAVADSKVDFRVVAATNQTSIGANGALRSDLYHRLATFVVRLPGLAQRREDIPSLVRSFLNAGAREFGQCEVEQNTLAALASMEWPGNIRELRCACTRAMATHGPGVLPLVAFREETPSAQYSASKLAPIDATIAERMAAALRKNDGNMRAAARDIGMAKSTFADRARRYGLVKPHK